MSVALSTAAADRPGSLPFPPPGVRAVVFDVVHTLAEPAPSVALAYSEAGCRHGIRLDPAVIEERFRIAWRRQELEDASARPAFATSRAREADRWRQIVADVFDDAPSSEAIFADLWDHFGKPTSWRAVPAGRQLLLAARAAGLPVALASNFDERLLSIAKAVERGAELDQLIIGHPHIETGCVRFHAGLACTKKLPEWLTSILSFDVPHCRV